MSAHAILSPSGASRWLACTPSARLEATFPDSSGDAAKEGTLAHTLGELIIRYKTKGITKAVYKKKLKEIEADRFYDAAMWEHADNYATFVLEHYSEALSHTKDAMLFIEHRIDLTAYIPEGFGTGDAMIIANRNLKFIDLKYGKGVPVTAENNRQLMVYALGALHEFDYLYNIDTVSMIIYQPRLDNFSVFEVTVAELKNWAETELIPRAKLAFDGLGDYQPGKHCQFCRAKSVCRANSEFNLQIAVHEFKTADLLEDHEIAAILEQAPMLKNWISGVEEWALNQALTNGKKFPGFKLVEGKSNRKYSDEEKVAKTLTANGFGEDIIFKKSLLGITALEKAIGKGKFDTLISGLLIKPQGAPALVSVADKRPELSSAAGAAADFEHIS